MHRRRRNRNSWRGTSWWKTALLGHTARLTSRGWQTTSLYWHVLIDWVNMYWKLGDSVDDFMRITGWHMAGGFQHPKIMLLMLLRVSCLTLGVQTWKGRYDYIWVGWGGYGLSTDLCLVLLKYFEYAGVSRQHGYSCCESGWVDYIEWSAADAWTWKYVEQGWGMTGCVFLYLWMWGVYTNLWIIWWLLRIFRV